MHFEFVLILLLFLSLSPAAIAPIKDGILSLDMAPSGGHTLYLTPATPEALEEVE